MSQPTVTIIGRINVGKSTLFNRLIEEDKAIVSKVPGTTRDKNQGTIVWRGLELRVIDTGGVDIKAPKDIIDKQIIEQTQSAIKQADLLLFVVDTKIGILPADKSFASILKKSKTPTFVVANKADKLTEKRNIAEFFKFGLGEPYAVSAKNGTGVGDLLDDIFKTLKPKKQASESSPTTDATKVAIIGKPNVGKSSLLNSLVGEKRVIVSEFPQTTREPQDIFFEYKDHMFQIIDTAGLKRKAKVAPGIDRTANRKAYDMIRYADIILLVFDSSIEVTRQDRVLSGLTKKAKAQVLVVANKWDVAKTSQEQKEVIYYLHKNLPPIRKLPFIFISAKTGHNVKKILKWLIDNKEAS